MSTHYRALDYSTRLRKCARVRKRNSPCDKRGKLEEDRSRQRNGEEERSKQRNGEEGRSFRNYKNKRKIRKQFFVLRLKLNLK